MKRLILIIGLILSLALSGFAADSYYFGTPETSGSTAGVYGFGISPNAGEYNFGWGFSLRDDFTLNVAAGGFSGANLNCVPGPGVRHPVDTNNQLSCSGGYLVYGTGGAGNYTDPNFDLGVTTRAPGVLGVAKFIPNGAGSVGFAGSRGNYTYSAANGLYYGSTVLADSWDGSNVQVGLPLVNGTIYSTATALKSTGHFLFIKGGIFTSWTLLYIANIGSIANQYFGSAISIGSSQQIDFINLPTFRFLPSPDAYDDFSAVFGTTSGYAGAGGYGAGGGGLTWTGPTWSTSGGAALNTPTLGPELNSGTLAVGSWYKITASEVDHFYTGSAVGDTFRAQATTALDANNKVKLITFAEMFATVDTGYSDVWLEIDPTIGTGLQCGGIICADSASNPQNFIQFHYNKTTGKAMLLKMVGGTYAADVLNVTATYSAGARFIIRKIGTSVYVFYNNALVGSATVSDAGIISNTIHGMFSTDPSASIGTFRLYKTTGYSILDLF